MADFILSFVLFGLSDKITGLQLSFLDQSEFSAKKFQEQDLRKKKKKPFCDLALNSLYRQIFSDMSKETDATTYNLEKNNLFY